MLDIGFLPDLQRILSYLPKQRTTLLFSATFSPEIKRLANSYLQTRSPSRWRGPTPPPPPWSSASTAWPDDDKRRAMRQVLKTRGSSRPSSSSTASWAAPGWRAASSATA
jgi:ATP-dependent RNA helicase RhlE